MSLLPDSSSLKQVFSPVLGNRNQHYQDTFNVLYLLKHVPLLRFTWCNEIQLCGRMSLRGVGAGHPGAVLWCQQPRITRCTARAQCKPACPTLSPELCHWCTQTCKADPYVLSSMRKETPQLISLLYHPLSLFPFPRVFNTDADGMASPAAQLCRTWLFTQWHLQCVIPKANQKQMIAKAFSRYLPTWRKLYWFSEGDSAVPNCLHSPPFPPLLLVTAAQ